MNNYNYFNLDYFELEKKEKNTNKNFDNLLTIKITFSKKRI